MSVDLTDRCARTEAIPEDWLLPRCLAGKDHDFIFERPIEPLRVADPAADPSGERPRRIDDLQNLVPQATLTHVIECPLVIVAIKNTLNHAGAETNGLDHGLVLRRRIR